MPKLATLLKVLRDGSKKGSAFRNNAGDSEGVLAALRDHFHRLELFWKKRYPKEDRRFVDTEVAKFAISADRDSVLGTIDNIAREFITFWLPELEVFMEEQDEEGDDKAIYKKIASGIEGNVINAVNRLDCGQNENATILRQALIKLAVSCLTDLFDLCGSLLDSDEQTLYNPKKFTISDARSRSANRATATKIPETISEARLLNSAVAWDVADHQESKAAPPPSLKSLVKRGFSEAFFDDGIDPADNGAVWDTSQTAKRQKFEIKISKVIHVSDSEGVNDDDKTKTGVEPRRILKPVSRSNGRKKSMAKIEITNADNQDMQVPGALKTADENCILM